MDSEKVKEIKKISPVYTSMTDLISGKLGGKVLYATDDFFAEKENLIKQDRSIFIPGKYTDRGKWMDGWESRRKRTGGHDWAIIQLAAPGKITGFDIDTSFFLGNHPPHASVEGTYLPEIPGEKFDWEDASIQWQELIAKAGLDAGSQNFFNCSGKNVYTHLKLHIYPDGGVARLRAYGEIFKDWNLVDKEELIDLGSAINGARAISCNDMFFSDMNNLLMPGRGVDMGDGWETKRNRTAGNRDWVIIQLATSGTVEKVIVDTKHFKGNFPDSCSLEGTRIQSDDVPPGAETNWESILPVSKLQADNEHVFSVNNNGQFTHVRFNIFPDGGVSRLRLFGKKV